VVNPIGLVTERYRTLRDTLAQGFTSIVMQLEAADALLPPGESSLRNRLLQARETARLSLAEEGVTILKFFLHISLDEQKGRLLDRIKDPTKQWKFRLGDLKERELWPEYMKAYEDVLRLKGQLVRVGDRLVLDLVTAKWPDLTVPAHFFMVGGEGRGRGQVPLAGFGLAAQRVIAKDGLAHMMVHDKPVITAASAEIHAFLAKFGLDPSGDGRSDGEM
jgi:hypothetical protein